MNSTPRTEIAALNNLNEIKHNRRIRITSFLQLESRTCLLWSGGLPPEAHRPALILLFAKKFFRGPSRTGTYQRFGVAAQREPGSFNRGPAARWRMRWNSVECSGSWLNETAFTASPSSRLHPRRGGDWLWEVVSSYSSATAPGFHGISRADPLFFNSQRTGSTSIGLRFRAQDLFISSLGFNRSQLPRH